MKRARGTGKRQGGKKRLATGMALLSMSKSLQTVRGPRLGGISSSSVFQNTSRRPELKFLDLNTPYNIGNAAAGNGPTLINGCAQGTDATQHIGRQTTMKSLYWLWEGAVSPTSVGACPARLVIFYDKESEGAAPTIAAGVQTDAFNQDNITAQNNLNNRDRFIILVDEVVECTGTGGPQAFMRKGYRKVALPCVFNASAASTIAAINTGGVFAVTWGTTQIATAPITSTLQTRIRFEDA